MNDRQAALVDYIRQILPELRGVSTVAELTDRLSSAMKKDARFIFQGLTSGAFKIAESYTKHHAPNVVESVFRMVGEHFGNAAKRRR